MKSCKKIFVLLVILAFCLTFISCKKKGDQEEQGSGDGPAQGDVIVGWPSSNLAGAVTAPPAIKNSVEYKKDNEELVLGCSENVTIAQYDEYVANIKSKGYVQTSISDPEAEAYGLHIFEAKKDGKFVYIVHMTGMALQVSKEAMATAAKGFAGANFQISENTNMFTYVSNFDINEEQSGNDDFPVINEVIARIINYYPEFNLLYNGFIEVTSDYTEYSATGGFGIYINSSDQNTLFADLVAAFDRLIDDFGYTKAAIGSTGYKYTRGETLYIEVEKDNQNMIWVALPTLPTELATWPAADVESFFGSNIVPAYTGTVSRYDNYAFTTEHKIVVYGTNEADIAQYEQALLNAGFILGDTGYIKKVGNVFNTVAIENEGIVMLLSFSKPVYDVIFPTSLLSADENIGSTYASEIPAITVSGLEYFEYDADEARIYIHNTTDAKKTEYINILLNNGYTKADNYSNRYVKDIGEYTLNLEVYYNDGDDPDNFDKDHYVYLNITKTKIEKGVLNLPTNLLIVCVFSTGNPNKIIKVGNDYCYYSEFGNAASGKILKYNSSNQTYDEYTLELGAAYWQKTKTEQTQKQVNKLLETNSYYGTLIPSLSGFTKDGKETILGVECDIYTLSESYKYYVAPTGIYVKMVMFNQTITEVTTYSTAATTFVSEGVACLKADGSFCTQHDYVNNACTHCGYICSHAAESEIVSYNNGTHSLNCKECGASIVGPDNCYDENNDEICDFCEAPYVCEHPTTLKIHNDNTETHNIVCSVCEKVITENEPFTDNDNNNRCDK